MATYTKIITVPVIELIESGADLSTLVDASLHAALTGLQRVPDDQGFVNTLSAIVDLVAASRGKDLSAALQQAGIDLTAQTSSFGFLSAVSQILSDRLSQTYPRNDVGKIAQDAFLASLTQQVRGKTGSLFGAAEDAKSLTSAFRGKQFETLMHEFYSGFTSRYLSYYLSRELPHHVGAGKRFASLDEHTQFAQSFDLYCRQTVRIADTFTSGWVSKAIYKGNAGPEAVRRYAHVTFKKLTSEFEKGGS